MSTAVAAPPATTGARERNISPRRFATLLPSTTSAPPAIVAAPPAVRSRARSNGSASSGEQRGSEERVTGSAKVSPSTLRTGAPPTIRVKKEPGGSPSMASARPRPKRLDLSSSTTARGPQTARPSAPLTSRDSAGLGVQDVGLACLSPGFQTHDPQLREQLQRSLDVRDQQRQIIEARQKGGKPGSANDNGEGSARTGPQDTTLFGVQTRTPQTSRRKGPPPGLSINAPSASHFANDRVIQSAPLHQTFTGLRPGDHPYTRHSQLGPSALGQTSHIHHVPATQTNNRLPPIADVFANDRLDAPRQYAGNSPSSHSDIRPPVPSPGFPPSSSHHHPNAPAPLSSRSREFRSADEAVHSLSGGRDELMPKVVHYRGVQPPTPPSPMPNSAMHNRPAPHTGSGAAGPISNGYDHPPAPPTAPMARPDILDRTASMNGRRRGREEYERDQGSSPPLGGSGGGGFGGVKRAAFAVRGEEERYEKSGREEGDWRRGLGDGEGKREEFLRLCERAWDLFHS
ncbi:hypothetical protein LTR95_002865 [Oleoguttula sp. CCFEE 5521]